ncbi:MAG: methyl-accepting chemotaxis protein [Microcoleaceae cyanobacterium]
MVKKRGWFQRLSLQMRIILAFLLMAVFVLFVGLFGYVGTNELTNHLNEVTNVRWPSLVALQKIDGNMRGVYGGEMALLNARLDKVFQDILLTNIKEAQVNIQDGYKLYDTLPHNPMEEKLWQKFSKKLSNWQKENEKFVQAYTAYRELGILDPLREQIQLMKNNQTQSAQMSEARVASRMLEEINIQVITLNRPLFNSSIATLHKLIDENTKLAEAEKLAAQKSVETTHRNVAWITIAGSLIALALGLILSIAIAKPLDKTIKGIINELAISTTEISTVLDEHEQIAKKQAIAVNATTITMDELGQAAQESSEQAESMAGGAYQALSLANDGNETINSTLTEMTHLNEQFHTLGQQIERLTEQTQEIGVISKLVADLSSQTNVLALNAAVEAVRAEEAGEGFSVIATEIRRLANASKHSAEKISRLVRSIDKEITSTVVIANANTSNVNNATQKVAKISVAFASVMEEIEKSVRDSQAISMTAQRQAKSIQQVLEAMNNINVGAGQAARGLSQTKEGTKQISTAAIRLKKLI